MRIHHFHRAHLWSITSTTAHSHAITSRHRTAVGPESPGRPPLASASRIVRVFDLDALSRSRCDTTNRTTNRDACGPGSRTWREEALARSILTERLNLRRISAVQVLVLPRRGSAVDRCRQTRRTLQWGRCSYVRPSRASVCRARWHSARRW